VQRSHASSGVPTTRALSVILTGDQVIRDMFYNGNPKPEPGAVVCRVAPSFTRFGNFQIFAARARPTDEKTGGLHHPHRLSALGEPSFDVYLNGLKKSVAERRR